MVLEAEKPRIKVPADQAASEGPLSSLLAMTAFYWVFTRQKEPGSSLVVRILGFHCQASGFSPWLGNWGSASLSEQPKRKERENDSSFSVPILRGPPLWLYLTVCCLVTKLCPTLCDPMGCSPPGSSVHGISQARTLEWVAISFSNAWKWKVKGKLLSRVQLLATPWTAAHQAPLPMGFSRQEYWSGVAITFSEGNPV